MIFFITLFRYFTIVLFFTLHFFSFSQGMQTRERAHCARSVFPFIKKKKKTHSLNPILNSSATKKVASSDLLLHPVFTQCYRSPAFAYSWISLWIDVMDSDKDLPTSTPTSTASSSAPATNVVCSSLLWLLCTSDE